ncbi:MAG: integrase core domain-containing protein, partial [Xanthobacteraceae bacterium]
KVERFWRTLDDDVIEGTTFDNLDHFANELFEYIIYYNNHRPHQALAGLTPKAYAATKATPTQSAN